MASFNLLITLSQPTIGGSQASRIPVLEEKLRPPISPIPRTSPSPPVGGSPVPPSSTPEPPTDVNPEISGEIQEEQESVYSSAEDLLDPIIRSRRPNAKFTNTPVKTQVT